MLAAASAAAAAALAPQAPPPLVVAATAGDSVQVGPGWRVRTLPRQSKPVTRFDAERIEGRAALRLEAQSSYGNLVYELPALPAPQRLHWAWRLQRPNPAVDLHLKAGDDTPAKVCLAFDLPLQQLPFGERQLLRLARAATGEPFPSATLCWVWGGPEPHGSLLDSPFTRRVRYIVLRNAGDTAGPWFDETRDVASDFLRAFGDEAEQLPPLIAVIVGADADNTHGHSVAHVGDLRFEP